MIKSQGKAADRSLRIYRPDISLEEICQTNGAGIVRAMIPCFRENPPFSYIYGVNVRTPRVDKILPFSTAYIYDKSKGVGEIRDKLDIKPGDIKLKVPDFTDKYNIRELFLYADIKNGKINPNDVIILSLTTDRDLKINPSKKINEIHQIKKDVCKKDGFFVKQANELGIKERAYLWLTSEDYNVNTAGDALSNIIAISDDFDAIETYIKPHRLDFINLLFLIKARYMFDTEIAQRKTAIASAKAAIMSRNMSHNLGSHVMAYLKQHLNSVQDMVRDNVLDSIIKSDDDLSTEVGFKKWLDKFKNQNEGLSKMALPFLVGLGKFISYLQERQDFIATIATNYVPYLSTVNFKDFVYDELNPDLRYKRHKDRSGLKPDNILLGNIARSEGLARKTNPTLNKDMSDIVLKYRLFDGEPLFGKDGKTPLPKTQVANVREKIADLNNMRDFMVSLPGGVVGRQAIFSIVENVIRNAAKHGKWGEAGHKNLELTFNRYYKEDIEKSETQVAKDYVPRGEETLEAFLKKYYYASMDIDDLCIVTLTDNMAFEPKLNQQGKKATKKDCTNLAAIQKALIEPYIDNSSVEMLQTNKGIKEMRISAAWLRGVEDDVKINPLYITEDFDNSKDKEDHYLQVSDYWDTEAHQWLGRAPILMVRACTNNPKEDYHLQYIFCIPKPKEVAIILSPARWSEWGLINEGKYREETKKRLSALSWGVFDTETYLQTKNKSYEFVIVDDEIDPKNMDKIRMTSPNRVFRQSKVFRALDINKDIISSTSHIDREFLKDKKVALFKILSKFVSSDQITISDKKTLLKFNTSHIEIPNSIKDNIQIGDGIAKAPYLYRTHNETEELFSEYLDATENYHTEFIEGITGDNSTDRLVRNECIDELWLYSHLHAMKTSVGVFDERIFSKIYKKDEADITMTEEKRLDMARRICYNEVHSKDRHDYRLKSIKAARSFAELESITGKKDLGITFGDYMAIAFEKKKVSIFNMIKTDDGLDIYGYYGSPKEVSTIKQSDGSIMERIKYQSIIRKVAEIKMGDDGNIKINKVKVDLGEFDYLTIHQGLLDKIYEQFDIRRKPYQKHKFTKLFYETFCSHKDVIEYKDEKIKEGNVFYLPYLRIHSGRSKPSFEDMPQHQPFMQYSAIEHALMDCKYSLVELLDFARYEDDK